MKSKSINTTVRAPTNYREMRRKEDKVLMILTILVLVVGGSTLIGLIWGAGAAITGALGLLGGALLIGGVWLLLSFIEK